MPRRIYAVLVIMITLTACQVREFPSQSPPPTSEQPQFTRIPPSTKIPEPSITSTRSPSITFTPTPTHLPVPTEISGQIINNTGFDSNILPWEERYGTFSYTTDSYLFGSGAARLVTTDQDARGDYFGLFGQCIDISTQLDHWLVTDEDLSISLEAYVKPETDIFSISLGATFHDAPHCGGRGPIGSLSQSFAGKNEWEILSVTGTVPQNAQSMDVFITANGTTNSATTFVDEVRAYHSPKE